jgi:hypothetical protein
MASEIMVKMENKYNYEEELGDTKGLVKVPKSKKDRQHNGQNKKDKRMDSDLQNIHIKLHLPPHIIVLKNHHYTWRRKSWLRWKINIILHFIQL